MKLGIKTEPQKKQLFWGKKRATEPTEIDDLTSPVPAADRARPVRLATVCLPPPTCRRPGSVPATTTAIPSGSRATAISARAHLAAAAVPVPLPLPRPARGPNGCPRSDPTEQDGQGQIGGGRAGGVVQRCPCRAAPEPQAQELPTVALLL